MNIEVLLVSAFTQNGKGGNPAGVVLQADGLTNEQKLYIAKAVGFSETAFVSKDDEVDFNVSFFTTTEEVDFCGHATLAVFSVMFQQGIITEGEYKQRTKAGVLKVSVNSTEVIMEQCLPTRIEQLNARDVSDAIGIEPSILESTHLPIEIISTGLPDIIIPVPKGYLDSIVLDEAKAIACCKKHGAVGFHIFELNEEGDAYTASCRNFAPLVGIHEESATGSASGALACYLAEYVKLNCNSYVFEQGRAMGCSSLIKARVELLNSMITKVVVSGTATIQESIEIPV